MILTNRVLRQNTWIIALFLFQYTLVIPIMSRVNNIVIVAVTSGILVVLMLVINRNYYVNRTAFFLFLLILFFLTLKVLFQSSESSIITNFVFYAFPTLIILSNSFSKEYFFEVAYKLSIISFVLLFLYPFYGSYEYMRFGYGMLLVPIFVFIKVFNLKNHKDKILNVIDLVIILLSLGEIVIYGARGAVFSFALFLALDLFFVHKERIIRNISIVIVAVVAYFNISRILRFFEDIAKRIGVRSSSLAHFRLQIEKGFLEGSSGRELLWKESIQKIKANPFLGNRINISDGLYAHNVFLQVTQDFGVVALLVFIGFLVYAFMILIKKDVSLYNKLILASLMALSLGRLMFSSVYWKRPEFWLMVCFALSLQLKKSREFRSLEVRDLNIDKITVA